MLVSTDNWQPQGIENLEPAALDALKAQGNILVTAGAGAGKSEFLAQKAAYLLQTGLCPAPQKILAISFKKDAAENLKERIRLRCEPALARRFDSLTFDGFTKRLYEQFYRAVPKDYRAAKGYDLAFYYDSHFRSFPTTGSYKKANWQTLKQDLLNKQLPLEADTGAYYFWQQALKSQDKAQLCFAMLNRLVEYLFRTNPYLLKALRLTYPFVFIDEFQDTTFAQLQLVNTLFKTPNNAITAVGDDKQKIMGWAGALPNAFANFEQQFNPQRFELLYNWRSHPELVEIQQRIANKIDGNAPQVDAKAKNTSQTKFTQFKEFDSTANKAASLAKVISAEVAKGELKAEDYAVLVRMHVNNIEHQLRPAFENEGIALRNLARVIGRIDLQELLKQELTQLVLPIFYLLVKERSPEHWQQATSALNGLQGLFADDEIEQQRLSQELNNFIQKTKPKLSQKEITAKTAKGIVAKILAFIGEKNIKQAVPAYQADEEYARALEGLNLLLEESLAAANNWLEVLDKFMGKNQVQLLTIHKSKGLEYHTVFVLGLDDNSWWSLKNTARNKEELNTLFVAVTRAQQRLYFLLSEEKGKAIPWVKHLLGLQNV